MDNVKYIGMDVHKEAISIAVLNSSGKLVMESTIETKASTILDFLKATVAAPLNRFFQTINVIAAIEAKKISSRRRSVFFLDSFYRTNQDLASFRCHFTNG
jgi:hypothetical protein